MPVDFCETDDEDVEPDKPAEPTKLAEPATTANPGTMTIIAIGTMKRANKPQLDRPTEPVLAKVMMHAIAVRNDDPEPTNHASEAKFFASSKKVTRTLPLRHTCPAPPPGAPSKLAHGATEPSDYANTNDKPCDARHTDNEACNARETDRLRKAGTPTSIVQALCSIRDKLVAMRTSGSKQHGQGRHPSHLARDNQHGS